MLGRAGLRQAAGRLAALATGGRLRRCGRLAVAVICLLPALAPARSAAALVEPVVVRAGVHPGFGRLVFEWPRAVRVERRQDGGRVILRFARPLAADLSVAVDHLSAYVRAIGTGVDDHEVALLLAPQVELELAIYDERIVAVDLRAAPGAGPPVELRTGSHPGFVRIVLDWPQAVGFEATASGSSWRIVFDREADIDAAAIEQRSRHLLDAAVSTRGDGRSALRLALKAGVRPEVFELAGARVVIDLHEPAGAAAATPAGRPVAPAAPGGASAPAAPAAASRPDVAAPAAGARGAGLAARPAPSAEDAPPATPLTLRVGVAGDERGAALDFAWSRPLPAAFLIRAGYFWSVFAPPTGEPIEVPDALASPLPGHLGPGELIEAAGGTALRFALRRPLAATVERAGARWRVVFGTAPTAPQPVRIERAEGPPRLRIDAGEPARLVRLTDPEVGDQLVVWPLLAAGRGQPAARRLVELELLPTAQGLAWRARSDDLRVQTSENALELVASGGLRLSARPAADSEATGPDPGRPPAASALRAAAEPAPVGRAPPAESTAAPAVSAAPRLVPPAAAAADRASTTERIEGGDPAAPEHQPLSSDEDRRPVDQVGLAAAAGSEPDEQTEQGDPAAPDRQPLSAGKGRRPVDQVGLAAASGSEPDERTERREPPVPERQPLFAGEERRLVDPVGLAAGYGADRDARPLGLARFAQASPDRSALQQRIAQAPPAERPRARLELARWFLARAMAPEARAVLDALGASEHDPAGGHQRVRERLAGAAALLMEQLDDAATALDDPALDADPEVALWRAALAAAREDWPRGARELERARSVLAGYPPALQLRLGLPAAQAASEAGAHELAAHVLSALAKLQLTAGQRARVAFYEGLAAARRGASARADEIWRALEGGPDHDSRIKSVYARVQLRLDEGRLDPEQALATLAPARALWRGHPWEARMLQGLAELYLQSGDRAGAIRVWHDLLAGFPGLPDAGRIDRARRAALEEVLLQDGTVGAVRAYALYRDFPELVAAGAAGDRVRRRLAARLAELDLLEPAAALLGELVEARPSGAARAEAGAELAALWLRAPDPAAALAALDRSHLGPGLPAELERHRRMLRARALAAARRPAEALALLDGHTSSSARALQAEILWQIRDWPRLAATLEELLGRRAGPAAALSETDQDLVLRLAIAYGQQADGAALDRLRARFGAAMRAQPGEPAFLMATMTPGRPLAPEAILAVAAEHLGRVRAYLAAEPAAP